MSKTVCIAVRTSMNVHNMYVKRPFNLTRKEMIFKCLKSLCKSCEIVKNSVFLNLVDNGSPDEVVEELEKIIKIHGLRYKIHKIKVPNSRLSAQYTYELLKKAREDIVFLADDDYLYTPQAISYVLNAFDDKIIGTGDFAINPFDDPDRYEKIYPSFIFVSKDCHWRSVGHATGSFFMPIHLFKKNWKFIEQFIKTLSEKDSISFMWKNIPLISPIPSLVAHLNEGSIPYFVDWTKHL